MSFALAPGQLLILRGPNGAGKTTLLRTLAGLQPPLGGEISGQADQIAYASHADAVKPTLSVVENLRFWAEIFGSGEVTRALEAVDLQMFADRPAANLSAGQKRRLGLAQVLVTGRAIWAMDEPTVSLDQHSVGLFAAALRAHLGRGGAAIIATHIELGVEGAEILDVSRFRAARPADEAFL